MGMETNKKDGIITMEMSKKDGTVTMETNKNDGTIMMETNKNDGTITMETKKKDRTVTMETNKKAGTISSTPSSGNDTNSHKHTEVRTYYNTLTHCCKSVSRLLVFSTSNTAAYQNIRIFLNAELSSKPTA